MHPVEAFIRNPVKVAVGVLLVALFGVIALLRMPMQLTPEVQIPTITIETRWPGASPQEVEREIVQEQEEQLKSVEGVTKMTSESSDSSGKITLEFVVGTNMDQALLKVNSRLQQVREYPEEADEPIISTANSSDRPIAWFILSPRVPDREEILAFRQSHPELGEPLDRVLATESLGLAALRLRDLAQDHPEVSVLLPPDINVPKLRKFAEDFIEARFERVKGVANANVLGGEEPELQVVVDPQKLAARQLTIAQVRQVLKSQNEDTSGGDFWEGKRRYVVRTLGQFRSPEQVADLLLAVRDGAPVYVHDVAEVRLGHKKPDGLVRRYGVSCLAVNVLRETGANVLKVMAGLKSANAELNESLLKNQGLELAQVYDETEYIYSAVGLVQSNIVVGGLLTVAVLLLFLRSGRSTLVIGLAIPTSIIGTFLMLDLMGRSLNVISLAGLAFAVGMLVDNAVVVLENVYRHYQLGKSPFSAAFLATKEVWGAVVASTLTTLAVFLPVLFVEEEAGQLFRDIALAISSAVGLSLIVSVTVIPTAAARLFRSRGADDEGAWGSAAEADEQAAVVSLAQHHPHGPYEDEAGEPSELHDQPMRRRNWLAPVDYFAARFVDYVVALNDWIQRGLLRRLAVVGLLVVATGALALALRPKVEYLPNGNRNLVLGLLLPPPGYNLDELLRQGQIVENELRPYWDFDPHAVRPRGSADENIPPISDFFFVARGRQVFLGLRAVDPLRSRQLIKLIPPIASKMPGTIAVAFQSSLFEQGLTAGRSIDVEITGPELTKLVGLGGQVMGKVGQVFSEKRKLPDGTEVTVPLAQARPVPSLDLSSPEVHVRRKPIQGQEMGVDSTDLGYTVNALVDGAYATDYYIGGDKIDLVIFGKESYASQTQDLESLPIATPGGQLIPLGALAEVKLSSGPEQINHRERQRAITIQVTPAETIALEDAIDRIRAQIVNPLAQSGQLEGGYLITLSGTANKLQNTWLALRWNLVLALIITYLLMAALFESWLYPLVIILSVPLGAVGGIAGLEALRWYLLLRGEPPQALDVLTMLGFVILIGTVVNNPILIVHQSLNHIREDGMTPRLAILESVRTRIRPIFMTTLTTVLGLAPLVFFPGAGSELYRGLGAVVLGGLLISTVFTLVLVPSLFSLTMDARDALARLLFASRRLVAAAETLDSATPAGEPIGSYSEERA